MSEINRLAALYLHLQARGDLENAEKVKQLVEKVVNMEFMIGFCGHFSAGKSTMMNRMMGKEVLPSSPIPTSANLVKIKKGRSYARIYYKHGDPVEFPAPYDYEVVKNFCKDGETIVSIEISDDHVKLPDRVAIMDTPGIDSTDEAHRISTESALHLADIILYVMDYNHVQSELNFTFTKTLKDRSKPVYLVINMIDKHNDDELSFESYKKSVTDAFQSWGVQVDGTFFTSLKDFDHPENQYELLEQFLTSQMTNKDELLLKSVMKAAQQLIEDHLLFYDKQNEKFVAQFNSHLEMLSDIEREKVLNEVTDLQAKETQLMNEKTSMKNEFEQGLQKILENAYLMPAATRELARAYIESCQSDFKIGFLFSKKKTEEERTSRLAAFYESFNKQASAQLEWHIKDYIVKFFKHHRVSVEDFINSVYEDVTVEFNPEFLQRLVKKGAGLTGEYILNYTKDVSNEIKRLYQKSSLAKFEDGYQLLMTAVEEELELVSQSLAKYNIFKEAIDGLLNVQKQRNELEQNLLSLLMKPLADQVLSETNHWLVQLKQTELTIAVKQMDIVPSDGAITKISKEVNNLNVSSTRFSEKGQTGIDKNEISSFNVRDRIHETVEKLTTAITALQGIKGLHILLNDMVAKSQRLENNRFTVALFGAFSAGKSSFANALIGQKLLPVSPNPTTATINKILPATIEHPHGTVLVKIKTKEQLLKDVEQSLSVFQKSCATLDEALWTIQSLNYDGHEAKEKPHYAFLKAVQAGYDHIANHLGDELTIDLNAFEEYVALEEKSCFVEWIELYYNCPLTEQGITLVDTPGADSINARHTGVAFEYIKNADAILFVTYYNHAFSKADREFLIQLGRVKEAFEMDKMFFIVNAADLAKSEEELKLVVDYVGNELQKYGIRFPRIYPLSSKRAIEEKLLEKNDNMLESGIGIFEQAFHSFIMNDLAQLSIQSANEDLKRSVISLEHIVAAAKESDEVKEQKRLSGQRKRSEIIAKLQPKEFVAEERALIQEIEELLFYVGQRVFFRYHDLFNEAFNPASIRDDGRDLKKILQGCFEELLTTIGFDLSQEMRATSLRVENQINKLVKEVHHTFEDFITQIDEQIQLLPYEAKQFETIEFTNAFETISREPFKPVLALFKGTKSFFEQGGKFKMKEDLEALLKEPVHHYLEEQSTQFKTLYIENLRKIINDHLLEITEEVNDYYEGYFAALSESIDIMQIEKARDIIKSVL
ncbi:dynamin family protein [Calidifontibacillus oryziterrae]|uniref:dynamin family protein n=1 Tax=Calidifontibacillus oryziterrae TaxID=1191699 RepID=UPI000301C4C7|nr:dynamin family protein [Calidifontibacillus oryziterrae]